MANGKKIKNRNSKISKACNNCFLPTHMKFNFSFISYGLKNLTEKEKVVLFDRIYDLSKEEYIAVAQRDKKTGFEIEKIDINKKIPEGFVQDATHRSFDEKYAIFRLYPNNNPTPARVIGTLINKIFYIFYIDIDGKLYEH